MIAQKERTDRGREAFEQLVQERQPLLAKRKYPLAAENYPPSGQAALWHDDMRGCVPPSGYKVGRQIARLCGEDSQVTLPWRSLADAVGQVDKLGRGHAYTRRGVEVLQEAGWLKVETIGQKRGAKTTFYLMPGDRAVDLAEPWLDEDDWLEAA